MARHLAIMHSKSGLALIELALVLCVLGLLMVPLLHTLAEATARKRAAVTRAALENARDALLNYAIHHNGCLPNAADFESSAPDTDRSGNGGTADTGSVRSTVEPAAGQGGQRGGDIPWADLALPARGLDGDGLRLQYYVASTFTSPTQTRASNDQPISRDSCAARLRQGIEVWRTLTPYRQGDIVVSGGQWYLASGDVNAGTAPPNAPWQNFGEVTAWQIGSIYTKRAMVDYQGAIYRALAENTGATPSLSPDLWRQIGLPDGSMPPIWQSHANEGYRRGELVTYNGRIFRALANMTNPSAAPVANTIGPDWIDTTLPTHFLETRLGPVINTAPGSTASATQNVFVLISTGRNRNNALGRAFVRDSNHMMCSSTTNCSAWSTVSDTNVDNATFSLTGETSAQTTDTILPVSYADYQSALAKAGLHPQPVQY